MESLRAVGVFRGGSIRVWTFESTTSFASAGKLPILSNWSGYARIRSWTEVMGTSLVVVPWSGSVVMLQWSVTILRLSLEDRPVTAGPWNLV